MYCEFNYLCPTSIAEFFSMKSKYGNALRVYAGGTDLLVLLRAGKINCEFLADVKKIADLQGIREEAEYLSIGAATTFYDLMTSGLVQKYAPALAEAAGKVGSTQIRYKATLGGNIMNASPAGDGLCAAFALNAEVVLASVSGIRKVSLENFILGPRKTAIAENELLTRIRIPKKQYAYQTFFKVGRRNALAISVVNGVVAMDISDGTITSARVALGAVAPTPIHIERAEKLLIGSACIEGIKDDVQKSVSDEIRPISDIRASSEYREYIAGVVVRRAVEKLWEEVH